MLFMWEGRQFETVTIRMTVSEIPAVYAGDLNLETGKEENVRQVSPVKQRYMASARTRGGGRVILIDETRDENVGPPKGWKALNTARLIEDEYLEARAKAARCDD